MWGASLIQQANHTLSMGDVFETATSINLRKQSLPAAAGLMGPATLTQPDMLSL